MIVYHGSNIIVPNPDIEHSTRSLDFGKGFYVTTVKEQAERWARRKAIINNTRESFICIYDMKEEWAKFKVKEYTENIEEWIDFVCRCRDGEELYKEYDIITGKVANDRVYRVVDMYKNGIWDKKRALEEIKTYDIYDQIAFISQKAIDDLLVFKESCEVSNDR